EIGKSKLERLNFFFCIIHQYVSLMPLGFHYNEIAEEHIMSIESEPKNRESVYDFFEIQESTVSKDTEIAKYKCTLCKSASIISASRKTSSNLITHLQVEI